MELLIEKIGEMAFAMQNARLAHWSEKFSKCVYSIEGFECKLLDKAFNNLYGNASLHFKGSHGAMILDGQVQAGLKDRQLGDEN